MAPKSRSYSATLTEVVQLPLCCCLLGVCCVKCAAATAPMRMLRVPETVDGDENGYAEAATPPPAVDRTDVGRVPRQAPGAAVPRTSGGTPLRRIYNLEIIGANTPRTESMRHRWYDFGRWVHEMGKWCRLPWNR